MGKLRLLLVFQIVVLAPGNSGKEFDWHAEIGEIVFSGISSGLS